MFSCRSVESTLPLGQQPFSFTTRCLALPCLMAQATLQQGLPCSERLISLSGLEVSLLVTAVYWSRMSRSLEAHRAVLLVAHVGIPVFEVSRPGPLVCLQAKLSCPVCSVRPASLPRAASTCWCLVCPVQPGFPHGAGLLDAVQ